MTTRAVAGYEVQLGQYPTPTNLSYAWSFGSLSGLTMVMQAATGFGLDTVYVPAVEEVPGSLEAIGRDAVDGWVVRGLHANTPSMVFLWLYCHQARSVLVGSRLTAAWGSGWVIILMSIVVAFLGYSCVWGQMSYWAATVITSLVTVVPLGPLLVECLWGGPLIGQPTLTRFIAVHYLLSLLVLALAAVHMVAVHHTGSSNPSLTHSVDKTPFMQYFPVKDGVALVGALVLTLTLVMAWPTATMDTELYMRVNTMSTPQHIIPEWYLLTYYAVLRCVPSKAMGCLSALGLVVLLLMVVVRDAATGNVVERGASAARGGGG